MGIKRVNEMQLWRLADALMEDILTASDGDILGEIEEDGTAASVQSDAAADLAAARSRLGKARLAAARRAVSAERKIKPRRARADPAQARRRLTRAIVSSSEGSSRFTLAAREGEAVPDEDLESLIEDATDLGINLGDEGEDSSDSS